MTGTDDRSPGSIGDMALSWGIRPEDARRIEEIAAAILVDAHIADERIALPRQRCGQRPRRGVQREDDQ
jgi:hypothetical protein